MIKGKGNGTGNGKDTTDTGSDRLDNQGSYGRRMNEGEVRSGDDHLALSTTKDTDLCSPSFVSHHPQGVEVPPLHNGKKQKDLPEGYYIRPAFGEERPATKEERDLMYKQESAMFDPVESHVKKKSKVAKILQAFRDNPLLWGKHYFPHHFRVPSSPFHLKLIIEIMRNRFIAIAAPRESSKSTLCSFLYAFHCIAFKRKRFIIIVQNTYKKAVQTLENIKKELRENERLRREFGIDMRKDSEGDTVFVHHDGFEIRVLCKGAEQMGSVRGEKFGAYRPDLIIIDDLEDDEMVKSVEQRTKFKDLVDDALLKAGDVQTVQVIVIGTILHDDSVMAKFVSHDYYKHFKKFLFRARIVDKQGNMFSLWNEKWTLDFLNQLEQDNPTSFAKEMQNDPVSGMNAHIMKEDFRYWRVENMDYVLFDDQSNIVSRGSLYDCKAAISCDLAWEEDKSSDFTAIVSGFLTPDSDILVDTVFMKKGVRPNEIEELLFSLESRLRSITGNNVLIGFEKAKLEKVMKWLLREAMKQRNQFLLFKDLQWDGDKIQRIITRLQPRYAQHSIYHKQGMGDLEHQLMRVPHGTHDDGPDALQGLVQLLQFPKQRGRVEVPDDKFELLRKLANHTLDRKKGTYVFGSKNKRYSIPARISIL